MRFFSIFIFLFLYASDSFAEVNLHWPLMDTLLRTGSCEQANMILKEIGEESPKVNLYKGVTDWCIGDIDSSLKRLEFAWSASEDDLRRKSHFWLLKDLKRKSPTPENFLRLWEIVGKDLSQNPDWQKFYLEARQKLGDHGKVCDFSPVKSADVFSVVFSSCLSLKREKELLGKIHFEDTGSDDDFRYFYLQSLYLYADKEKSLKIVSEEKVPSLWLSKILLYLGQSEKNDLWTGKGYRMYFQISRDFESLRDLCSWLFQNHKDEEAKTVLIDFLEKNSASYQQSTQAARLLLDHGHADILTEFINSQRKKMKNPLHMSELILLACSNTRNYQGWLDEISNIFPGYPPYMVAKRILDSWQSEDLQKLVGLLVEKNEKQYGRTWSLELLGFLALQLSPRPDWLSSQVRGFSDDEKKMVAIRALNTGKPELVIFLFEGEELKDQQIRLMMISALFQKREFLRAWRIVQDLESVPKMIQGIVQNLVVSLEETRGLVWQYHENTELSPVIREEIRYQRALREGKFEEGHGERLQSYLEILARLSDPKNIEETMEVLKSWLHRNIRSPYFAQASRLYLRLLDYKAFREENFFPALIEVLRFSMASDPQLLSKALESLEASLEKEGRREIFSDFLLYQQAWLQRLVFFQSKDAVVREKIITEWEKLSRKLFEEFPDSFYTPISVEQLIEYYETSNQIPKRDELARNYLLRFPSDLLSQKLRNLLLSTSG